MNLRKITDGYFVSPQIAIEDIAEIKAAGFTKIICNRPDAENPAELQSEAMKAAVAAAGIEFEYLPLTHQTMTLENVSAHAGYIGSATGKVLAYCASGNRSSVVWSLNQATTKERSVDEIMQITTNAGYDLSGLRGRLDDLARA